MLLDHLTDPASFSSFNMAASNNLYASSPVVGIPPTEPNQYFASSHYADATAIGQTPGASGNSFLPTPGSIPPTPGSLAGRKRSRGDITAPDDEEEQLDPGYRAAVESQFGSWAGEQAERKPFELSHIKRPSVSSRKSQRRDAGTCDSDDLAQLVLPPSIREATAEPLIDEATRVLGISWTRMDSTDVLRIHQAAYSKWIQNHYPGLRDVVIWFENSAIPGYLVQAQNVYNGQEGYYIFSEDLTEGRLVTTEPEQLVPRLKMLPALHLAAPGGHIRAESELSLDGTQVSIADEPTRFSREVSQLRDQIQDHAYPRGESAEPQEPNGMCSAHQMDLD